MSLALDDNGKVYVWGEGYSNIAIKIIFNEKVSSISGRLLLTEKGEVFDISNLTTRIKDFKDISKISCGENHAVALSSDRKSIPMGK